MLLAITLVKSYSFLDLLLLSFLVIYLTLVVAIVILLDLLSV
jgi:hypothetical protein